MGCLCTWGASEWWDRTKGADTKLWHFYCKDLFVYLFARKSELERESERRERWSQMEKSSIHLFISQISSMDKAEDFKSETRNFMRFSHVGDNGRKIWAKCFAFPPALSRKLDMKRIRQSTNQYTCRMSVSEVATFA